MEPIWEHGIGLVRALRELAPGLLGVMALITELGGTYFYLLLVPTIYWSLHMRLGRRLVWVLLASFALNTWLKLAIRHPRPYWVATDLPVLAGVGGFGMPSGHAQHAAAVWGSLAFYPGWSGAQRRWIRPAALGLAALIGFSRVYLGVHFPTDVLAGWLVGAGLVWLGLRWEALGKAKERPLPRGKRLFLAAGVALLVGGVAGSLWPTLRGWPLPAAWHLNAIANSGTPIDATDLETIISVSGLLAGVVVGLVWNAHGGPRDLKGSLATRLMRLLVGLAGAAALWFGIRYLGASTEGAVYQLTRFLRYGLVALWVAGAAPFCFRALGLAIEAPRA